MQRRKITILSASFAINIFPCKQYQERECHCQMRWGISPEYVGLPIEIKTQISSLQKFPNCVLLIKSPFRILTTEISSMKLHVSYLNRSEISNFIFEGCLSVGKTLSGLYKASSSSNIRLLLFNVKVVRLCLSSVNEQHPANFVH